MSFTLKPNNRKNRAGATLIAKIVSPDKQDFAYREYPVLLHEQALTDQEAVIRDKQQVDAIISSSNSFWNEQPGVIPDDSLGNPLYVKTESIKGLTTALTSATNGSTIDPPKFTVQTLDGEQIISDNGEIKFRPKYKGDDTLDFMTTMTIDVHKGDVKETYTQDIIIPAWTKEEIAGDLESITGAQLWELIKGQNGDHKLSDSETKIVYKNFADLSSDITPLYTLLGLDKKMELDIPVGEPDYLPKLTLTYPNIIEGTPFIAVDKKTVTRPSVADCIDTYKKTASLKVSDISDAVCPEGNGFDPLNIVSAYTVQNATSSNAVTGTIEFGGNNISIPSTQLNIAIMSSLIKFSHFKANFTDSSQLSWIVPQESIVAYSSGISGSTSLKNNSSASPFSIQVGATENFAIKLPSTLSDIFKNNPFNDGDGTGGTSPIGYSYSISAGSTVGTAIGFNQNLFTSVAYRIYGGLNTDKLEKISALSISDVISSPAGASPISFISSAIGETPTNDYLVINNSYLDTTDPVILEITFTFTKNNLDGGNADNQKSFFLSITKGV